MRWAPWHFAKPFLALNELRNLGAFRAIFFRDKLKLKIFDAKRIHLLAIETRIDKVLVEILESNIVLPTMSLVVGSRRLVIVYKSPLMFG